MKENKFALKVLDKESIYLYLLLNNILYIIATHPKQFLWNNQPNKQGFSCEISMQMLNEQVLYNGMDICLICNVSLKEDLDDETWVLKCSITNVEEALGL